MQGDYGRVREGNASLSERLQEVKMENKAMWGTLANFERVKRAFGPEEVERAVEDAKRWGRKSGSSRKQGGSLAGGRDNGQREGAPMGALLIYTCQRVLSLL